MQLNEFDINENEINSDLGSVELGILITIGKQILSRATLSGTIITVGKQIITSQDSKTIITVGKRIQDTTANTFYSRNGWEPVVVIGSVVLRANQLHGGIKVTKSEGDNTTAEVTIILTPAIYNLYTYQGKDAYISVRTPQGFFRLFTGKVDNPIINVLEEKLTLQLVADRRILLNNISSVEPYIGYYSATILGDNENTSDRIEARMSTIAASLDFDSWNAYSINSWTPKATADFSYGSNAVYRRQPQLTIDSSGQILNQIKINLEYGYQRHHGQFALYNWQHTYCPINYQTGEGGVCAFLQDAPTMPSKEMILNAINSAQWPIVPQTLFFGKIFKSGSYRCNGIWAQWSTTQENYINEQQTNADGSPKTDSAGNPVYKSRLVSSTDFSNVYTMYAQWISSTRFNQNVKEKYTITVTAPDSTARYGIIPSQESYGYTAKEVYSNWESYEAYQPPPVGPSYQSEPGLGSYWFNDDSDRATFNNAYICAINKAKTSILSTHRNTRIIFQRPLTPLMELKHTVALTGKWIKGKGKCNRIVHNLFISDDDGGVAGEAYTEVELLQYRSTTTVTDTPLLITSPPIDTKVLSGGSYFLGNHIGEDPEQPGSENWDGYVGNKVIDLPVFGVYPGVNHTRTNYQESFIVQTPAIAAELRDDKVNNKSITYNVNIPNDSTTYESYG